MLIKSGFNTYNVVNTNANTSADTSASAGDSSDTSEKVRNNTNNIYVDQLSRIGRANKGKLGRTNNSKVGSAIVQVDKKVGAKAIRSADNSIDNSAKILD